MLIEDRDVPSIVPRAGYETPSQFNREFPRAFGFPPAVDAARLRAVAIGDVA